VSVEVDATLAHAAFELRVASRIPDGSVVAVLGPNGAGKSTLLRAIAGLHPVASGAVWLDGRTVDDAGRAWVPPRDRLVGFVPQDYALFPHLTVRQNVAFGPRARGIARSTTRRLVDDVLERFAVAEFADRRPAALSGGQAQRVALARALATAPRTLLLDEPLAALDVRTRDEVRAELIAVLASFDGSTVLVTHEPLDALILADRILVLEGGAVVQDATPAELSRQPATDYVAALVGVTLLRGTARAGAIEVAGGGTLHVADTSIHGSVLCVVRPESVSIARHRPEGSARNCWPGTVSGLQSSTDRVRVSVQAAPSVVAAVTPAAVADLGLAPGMPVWVSVKATDLAVYPA